MNSHHSLVEFKKLGIKKILLWFNEKRRIYPWRLNRTPYSVWISEIMLQQTVISTVIPYFQKWMKKYPTIFKLSESSEKEVLTFWQGLGYYSRVKNILKAAKMIINDYKGSIPDDYEQLIQLPGIGDYTSSAILSIAFNKPYPVIDANVKRVMSRVFGWRIWTILLEVKLKNILKELIFNRSPREFNESIMELGKSFM